MENPAYWTELHWKILRASGYGEPRAAKVKRIVAVLEAEGYTITAREVEAQLDAAERDIKEVVCGLSLPSRIVNCLSLRGERS